MNCPYCWISEEVAIVGYELPDLYQVECAVCDSQWIMTLQEVIEGGVKYDAVPDENLS